MKRKLTAKQIAAGFGGKRAKAAAKGARKRARTNKERKALGYTREKTMAKAKRKTTSRKRRGGVVRRRAGAAFKRHKVDLAAMGVAAAYGYAQGAEMQILTSVPVLTPVGRAGTLALLAYGAAKLGIAPKYSSAVARGMANIAVYNLARRRFKPYDETEARAIMSGADEALLGAGDDYLEGDDDEVGVELEYEPAA